MGSLKDEMRGLGEDRKPCEKADDGERPGGSDGSAAPQGPQINTSQESASQGDHQPKPHMNANYEGSEEGDKNPISKDQVLLGGVCDNAEQSDSGVKDPQKHGADKSTAASCNDTTVSDKPQRDGESDTGRDREKEAEIESISVPVPATPGPSDPWSPAPEGQHHMRTQVSLEVVQCRSAATSPMTPPEDGQSFFFPSSFGRSGAKDAELQVGQQVEFCSVATSPMTPKTPSTTAFPELIGRETVQKAEGVGKSDEGQKVHNESLPVTKSQAKAESEITGALKFSTSKELSEGFGSNASPEGSAGCPASGFVDSQASPQDAKEQPKQQRMGSMDQDITILVTHYDNKEEEEEESSVSPAGSEMVKIDEYEEPRESNNDETVAPDSVQDYNPPQAKAEESTEAKADVKCENSEVNGSKRACEDLRDISVTKPLVPESPAPFGCQSIRTQVSLEVVQCQSVATSPMTPPEGDHAFYFPSSIGRSANMGAETRDAEMQVGQQVEFRSVATAPMTPRTPTTTAFPEITKEASVEEKIVEEEEEKKERVAADKEEVFEKEEKVTKEENKVEADEEDTKEAKNCKDKVEEPVQEVSWDEKGMTWEVYGAVVEVTVLGSAIQKHLEKQVKKRQPSMPPPPPLKPSAVPLSSESRAGSGSGKGRAGKRGEQDGEVSRRRRNPFRLMMENMQQPHCCSKAHTTE